MLAHSFQYLVLYNNLVFWEEY